MKTQLIIMLTFATIPLFGQTGCEWIERNENAMKTTDQEVNLTMQLVSKNGNIRERTLSWSNIENAEGLSSSYLRFTNPADIAGTAFLSIENPNGNDDQWLYLPALKRSRRISSNEKGKSFMGSDFTYTDIGIENTDESNYQLIETIGQNGKALKVIEARYKNPDKVKESGYAKRIIYIDSSNNMMVKTELFDVNENHFKTFECSDFKTTPGSRKIRPHRYEMKDLQKGTSTILLFSNYQIDKGIAPNRFTIRYLESN